MEQPLNIACYGDGGMAEEILKLLAKQPGLTVSLAPATTTGSLIAWLLHLKKQPDVLCVGSTNRWFERITLLREVGILIPIIAVADSSTMAKERANALNAGADYCSEMVALELIESCKAVTRRYERRKNEEAKTVSFGGEFSFNYTSNRLTNATTGRPIKLSPFESIFLKMLLEAKGTIVADAVLLEGLSGRKTDWRLDNLKYRLCKKLSAGSSTPGKAIDFIRRDYENGYCLTDIDS